MNIHYMFMYTLTSLLIQEVNEEFVTTALHGSKGYYSRCPCFMLVPTCFCVVWGRIHNENEKAFNFHHQTQQSKWNVEL